MADTFDQAIILAKQGDERAFAVIYRTVQPGLRLDLVAHVMHDLSVEEFCNCWRRG